MIAENRIPGHITVRKAVNEEAAELSPKNVRNVYGLLSSALSAACPDMSLRVRLPQKKADIIIPTEEEVRRLMDTAKGTDMEIPVLLAACCGMRRSEIAALTWSDVDFEAEMCFCIFLRNSLTPHRKCDIIARQGCKKPGEDDDF